MDPGLTETAKVTLALQFCVGERAGLWANRQTKMLLKGDRSAITTLEKFGEEVEKVFGDPEQMQRAQRKLEQMRMRRGQSLQELKVIFEEHAEESGLGEAAQIRLWCRMITVDILKSCYNVQVLPTDLAGWKELSIRHDERNRTFAAEMTGRSAGTFYYSDRPNSSSPPRTGPNLNAGPRVPPTQQGWKQTPLPTTRQGPGATGGGV